MSEIITRAFDFTVERSDEDDHGLRLEGYAAVFNSPTSIDSLKEGRFTEVISPGAFSKTISERTPVLMFDHGTHPLIGSLPLGTISTIREDDHGLFVRARLSDNWLIQPVRDAIADGAVRGMSFKFSVPREKWDRKTNTRTLLEIDLMELGPVVFPAYKSTSVGVRSRQLIDLLADEEVRAELATLLTFGQPSPDAGSSTSVEESDTPQPAPVGIPQIERLRAFRRAVPKIKELQNA